MPRSWTGQEVAEVVAAHPEWLGAPLSAGEPHRVGRGESYEAWLPAPAGPLVRFARRPIGELPADPAEEVAGMRLAPQGVGPRPIGADVLWVDDERYPVVAQEFVPGRVLAPIEWTGALRRVLAAQLATLHTVTYPRPGSVRGVSQALDPEPGRLDFAAEVDGIIDHWAPRLPGAPGEAWAALCGPMQRYAAEVAPEIAALQEFSLIHGDPVLTNIVVDGNRPVLIDWEWTQIGDPARDLGFIGGAVHAGDWYAALTDKQITDLLRAYVSAGGRGEVVALRRRRDAWLAAEGLAVLAYLWWVDADPAQAITPANRSAAADLQRTVAAYLAAW